MIRLNWHNRKAFWMLGGIWTLCAAMAAFFAIWVNPSLDVKIQNAQRQQRQLQEQMLFARSAQKEQTKQNIEGQLETICQKIGAFSMPNPEQSNLIFKVGQLASSLGLQQFVSASPDSIPDPTLPESPVFKEGWLNISFKSDFFSAAAFINALERNQPVMFIETLSLRQDDQNPELADVKIMVSYLIQTRPPTQLAANR